MSRKVFQIGKKELDMLCTIADEVKGFARQRLLKEEWTTHRMLELADVAMEDFVDEVQDTLMAGEDPDATLNAEGEKELGV